MQKPPQSDELAVKEISPNISARTGSHTADELACIYDLVEQMQYLYVRVVKARGLPGKDVTGSCDPYVEVKLGDHMRVSKHFERESNPEWNQVFAFSKDKIQDSVLEVFVKDKVVVSDDLIGQVMFGLNVVFDDLIGKVVLELSEILKRVPPDSPLPPKWYRLKDSQDKNTQGELMLAVWMGTQADEAFPNSWHPDAVKVGSDGVANIRCKEYLSPELWYVRVNVIEAQSLIPNYSRFLGACVNVAHGTRALRTRISQSKTTNPMWNEELTFVVAEPFEEPLLLTVEDLVAPSKYEVLGMCVIPLKSVLRRLDPEPMNSGRFDLKEHIIVEGEGKEDTKIVGIIHLRVCLDGASHVLDESIHYSCDLRPSIGSLEVGILSATGLMPMKTKDDRGTTDAYCVAKYGQKWVRTRTIVDHFSPQWNEQYTWEVFDPCTVVKIGVFDNGHVSGGGRDAKIGKVRIYLSTLETGRVYTHSYPLLVLFPSGVKKRGEIQLAVRFSCSSLISLLHLYSRPLLPKMHYFHPLSEMQLLRLRHEAMGIVSMRLSQAEPPLKKEVVERMLHDEDWDMWSLRKSKVNFFRIAGVLTDVGNWFDSICNWRNPLTTILIHILFIMLVLYPKFILPTVFLCLLSIGMWNFRCRPRHPPHMDTQASHADAAHPDELDEEFDTFPTTRPPHIVRMRYDRLRCIAGRIQRVINDLVTQGERFQSLLSWRDPRATTLFMLFCMIAAVVLYVTPLQVVALLTGIYVLRHPIFRRSRLPSVPLNFFRRLPARSYSLL